MDFKIRVGGPFVDADDIENMVKALREGRLSSGSYAESFEKEFAKYIGVKHAVSVNSATSALQLMLATKRIGKGDEVITTPYTYAATSNVIVLQGAKPIFADIELDSFNIDTKKIQENISKKTKAIMPIHYGGQSSDMDEILEISTKNNLLVFEDAAPSAGAIYKQQKVGSIGDAGAFSFFPDKNMTTGEGGMITTNSDEIAELSQIMKRSGAKSRYYHTEIGWNFKMPDPNAALGLSQLKKLPRIIIEKQKLADNYKKLFEEDLSEYVLVPDVKDERNHTFNLFSIRLKNEQTRDKIQSDLLKNGIETRICFPPVHLQPIYQKLYGFKPGMFPNAELCAKTTLCMPMITGLSIESQEEIVNYVKKSIGKDNGSRF